MKDASVFEPTFRTSDMQLAAVLSVLGAKILSIDRTDTKRCTFVFEKSPDLECAVQAFWHRQISVEPQALLTALKDLKNRVYNEGV